MCKLEYFKMVVFSIIKIFFNILLFLPLTAGVYCFNFAGEPFNDVCSGLQTGNNVTEEECCTIQNITESGGGFTEDLVESFNDTYECTFCSSIRVADHWTEWSECNVTCGEGGIIVRSRTCAMDTSKLPEMRCHGESQQATNCRDLPPCGANYNETAIHHYPPSTCDERIGLIIVTILLIIAIIIFIGFCIYVKWKKKLQEKKDFISKMLSVSRKSEDTMSSSSMIFQKRSHEQRVSDISDDYFNPIPLPSPTSEVQRIIIPSILYREDSETSYTDIYNKAESRGQSPPINL